jgi:hypothetical protein
MIWILLVVFQIKHFIADYPLQTPYMLGKFKDKGWIKPLSAHCGVQAIFTFLIAATALGWDKDVGLYVLGLSALDFTIHFIMDRIKASPKMLGRYESISKGQFKGLSEARSLAVQGIGFKNLDETAKSEIKIIDAKFKGNKYFWWALGFDQMVHHLTDILIIFLIIKAV